MSRIDRRSSERRFRFQSPAYSRIDSKNAFRCLRMGRRTHRSNRGRDLSHRGGRQSGNRRASGSPRRKVVGIPSPWLILRFIDPRAVFLFVAASEVPGVAERFGAVPFDLEGVFWRHRGDRCTFDLMVEEFGLTTEPLLRLATMVRGADTGHLELAPQSAGLLAASLGLSRMYTDDLAQLEAGLSLYDAFYRWCRDAVDETHTVHSKRSGT